MPMPSNVISAFPEETIRVAHAAFPRGNMYLSPCVMSSAPCTTMSALLSSFRNEDDQRKHQGLARWSVSSSLWKGSLIAKQQRQCAAELTGNTLFR